MLTSFPMYGVIRTDLHIYSGASEQIVVAVAYLKVSRTENEFECKSKLSLRHGHILPRLEFCSIVLASEIAIAVTRQLNSQIDATYFYFYSKVILGY